MEKSSLEKLRTEIDEIDGKIIRLFGKRMEAVKKIGLIKKSKDITSLDMDRWQKVLQSRIKLGKEKKISEKFIEKIWNLIHQYSLSVEEKAG